MNFFGLFVIIGVSRYIIPNKLIEFLGKNSIGIFLIHIPFLYYIYIILLSWTKDSIFDNIVLSVLYCLLICIILYPILMFLNKYMPITTGNGKLFVKLYKKVSLR